MEKNMMSYFDEGETEKPLKGYNCSIRDIIMITILRSLCGLKNVSQIHQWAASEHIGSFLKEKWSIEKIPCYYWMLCLMKIIKPESLNECFKRWTASLLPEERKHLTIAMDGTRVRSTESMGSYDHSLHIISARLSELGITLDQVSVEDKRNEIPAMQKLIQELKLHGCMVVADALNCQKETATLIVKGKADYLLSVKDNHPTLKDDIATYIQDETLQAGMESFTKVEKSRDRIEKRTGYATTDISWLPHKEQWKQPTCIGAIRTEFESKKGKSLEWHYYISSRKLSATELLHHARMGWAVESMHWLLDIHFDEDGCRAEDKNIQQNLTMLHKAALNTVEQYQARNGSKCPMSKIMFACLLDSSCLHKVLGQS
ncbi:MAG: ISAs1 family transposase [Candidatus Limiplasma sp.]|nr:ISAs1 family transposase [Candidatus Limiplasma sp.]